MLVGSRIVLLFLMIATAIGIYTQSFDTFWKSFLTVIGFSFIMKLVNQRNEQIIMGWVEMREKQIWENCCLPVGHCMTATVRGLAALCRGREVFPPVSQV